jgi:hypothetical protein
MTDKAVGRTLALCLTVAGLCLLASCGAEAPWFATVNPADKGNIIVRSTPTGAAIFLGGVAQHTLTPDTLRNLDPGTYEITVELTDHDSDPEMVTVNLASAETDSAVFTLTPTVWAKKVVLLEGFSNVSCPPCPELTDNLVAMAAKPEFPSDRVQYLEFAVSWPQLADPFFLANPQENSDRWGLYNVASAPDLYIDGVRQVDALDANAMESAVLAAMNDDPGFEIAVSADFSSSTVPVTVILTANRNLDLTGHVLFVAIYEKEIEILPAPGTNGQTEFHHVFRDRVDTLPTLGAVAPGTPQQFDLTLTSGSAGADAYVAVAFVQHDTSHAILQAGSTAAAKMAESARCTGETAPVRSLERKFR